VLFAFTAIFFDLLSLQRQHPLLWSENELTIPGTKVPGNIRWEHSFPGAKVPTGNFRTEERKYRRAKSPDSLLCHLILNNERGPLICTLAGRYK